MRPRLGVVSEGATENQRPGPGGRLVVDEGNDRTLPDALAGVSSRCGDPAIEEQASIRAKRKVVTGCFRAKPTGVHAIGIKEHFHAGNRPNATSRLNQDPHAKRHHRDQCDREEQCR